MCDKIIFALQNDVNNKSIIESFASSISLQQVQWLRIRDTRYRKTACDIADPMDLLNTGWMEISKPYWEPLYSEFGVIDDLVKSNRTPIYAVFNV